VESSASAEGKRESGKEDEDAEPAPPAG
jgi:hypothetical protein